MNAHYVCPQCGPHIAVDEDGCCVTCGQDTAIGPCCGNRVKAERDRIVAFIRARAQDWEPPSTSHWTYRAQARIKASAARLLADLIEQDHVPH